MEVAVQSGQSLWDVALAAAGDASAAFALAVENGLSLTEDVAAGTALAYGGGVLNRGVAGYFAGAGRQPATALAPPPPPPPPEVDIAHFLATGDSPQALVLSAEGEPIEVWTGERGPAPAPALSLSVASVWLPQADPTASVEVATAGGWAAW